MQLERIDNVDINRINLNGAQLFNCKWRNLRIQELNKLKSHCKSVNSVCFSPKGNLLASWSSDNTICILDAKAGQKKARMDGHSKSVKSVCFSVDGNTLASGSQDNSIRLWDVKKGRLKPKLEGHRDAGKICHSPDGITLATGDALGSVYIYIYFDRKISGNRTTKEQFDGHFDSVLSVCFSSDGTTLASGSKDKYKHIFDVSSQLKDKLYGHCDSVLSVCFSPNGTILASSSEDETIRLGCEDRKKK